MNTFQNGRNKVGKKNNFYWIIVLFTWTNGRPYHHRNVSCNLSNFRSVTCLRWMRIKRKKIHKEKKVVHCWELNDKEMSLFFFSLSSSISCSMLQTWNHISDGRKNQSKNVFESEETFLIYGKCCLKLISNVWKAKTIKKNVWISRVMARVRNIMKSEKQKQNDIFLEWRKATRKTFSI